MRHRRAGAGEGVVPAGCSRDVDLRVRRTGCVRCHRISRLVRILSALGVGLVWLALPSAAIADLSLVFTQSSAHPGDRVEVLSAERSGRGVSYPAIHEFRRYFVPMDLAKSGRHQRPSGQPTDPGWVSLGPLGHSAAGVVRFAFVVPDVRPGAYTVGIWCRQCAPPQGATFTVADPGTPWRDAKYSKVLRISARERPAPIRRGRGISRSALALAVVAAFGLLGCFGISRYCRRASRRANGGR